MNAQALDPVRHYGERVQLFESEQVPPGGIVLVGSSHIERFDAAALLPKHRIVNRGIAGDRLDVEGRGVANRLEVSVFRCRPTHVIFENGGNDLGELWRTGRPAMSDIVDTLDRTLRVMRDGLPAVPIDVMNVLPTTGRFAGMSPLVPIFNRHVECIAARLGCGYVDAYTPFADSCGHLREELTCDGLHLNDAGYAIFAELIRARLAATTATNSETIEATTD